MESENESFIATLIERFNDRPSGMLRLSVVAAAMFDYGHQVARLDKLVDHYHRGEIEESEPFDVLLKRIRMK
jgi:hypothetical protein